MKMEITPVAAIPEISVLIPFAAAGQLTSFQEFGRVIVMDIAACKANNDTTEPWAMEFATWLAKGPESGGAQAAEIVKSEIGDPEDVVREVAALLARYGPLARR